MFIRRMLPVSVILVVVLTTIATMAIVSAESKLAPLGGSVVLRDAAALNDSLVVDLDGVPQPAVGTNYEGWLISDDGNSKIVIGTLAVSTAGDINITYTSPDGSNLLTEFSAFAIASQPSGVVLYSDNIEPAAIIHVRHLLSESPSGSKGFAASLSEHALGALAEAGLASGSASLADKKLHLQRVVNIIEGPGGSNYDTASGNPGNGTGVLSYAADAIVHAGLAKAGAPANGTIATHADGLAISAQRASDLAARARDNALTGITQTSANLILTLSIDNVVSTLTRAVNGTDDDGNGIAGGSSAEGGADRAYIEAQNMASFALQAGTDGVPEVVVSPEVPDPPKTGDSIVGSVATITLMIGLALVVSGATLLARRRNEAA